MDVRYGLALVAVGCAVLLAAACGGSSSTSPGNAQTSFKPPAAYRLASLTEEPRPGCVKTDFVCAAKFLMGIAGKYGPGAALGVLGSLEQHKEIEASLDTHQLAHAVGRETAARFGINPKAFRLCPLTFNYGCVHGFFEYVLGRTDTPSEAAASICNSSENASLTTRFSCYHGVGHGVMMARAYDLRSALDVCDTLGDSTAEDGCWQGVFMENVNAGMRSQARPGMFSAAKPLRPCTTVAGRYQQECYINQAGWLMDVARNNVGRAAGYCRAAPRRYVGICAQSIGLMVTNPVWQATLAPGLTGQGFEDIAWGLCERFPQRLRLDCVIGAADNIANFDGLDLTRAKGFCAVAGESYRTACYREVGVNLKRRTNDLGLISRSCASLPPPYAGACNRGAKETAIPKGPAATAPAATTPTSPSSTQAQTTTPAESAVQVKMEAEAFSPSVVTISKGQTVTFVNVSDDDKWPASDFHPTHLLYPGFDAQRSIPPGQSYSFTFERRGRWTYHNHLDPLVKGTVVVR
jgi:plastocyanin